MNKVELIAELAARTEMKKSQAAKVITALFGLSGIIPETLAKKGTVRVSGFGVFGTKDKNARVARNPKTGAKVNVPKRTVPTFRFLASTHALVVKTNGK